MTVEQETTSSAIMITDLRKVYPSADGDSEKGNVVFDGFNLTVKRAELLTIFGPNACGKSTLLHILAGLTGWDEGEVRIDDQAAGEANVGFVFQDFRTSLFPWKRNIDNMAWPLELRGLSRTNRREAARTFMRDLGISLPEQGYPYELSGGQQQLLAIARALVSEPTVLLMDEPFNQLDYQTRLSIQKETLRIWRRTSTTLLFVSHDLEEALLLGDRTVLLSRRPAKTLETLTNPLPRPRTHDMLQSPEFFAFKSNAMNILRGELSP